MLGNALEVAPAVTVLVCETVDLELIGDVCKVFARPDLGIFPQAVRAASTARIKGNLFMVL